MKFKLPLCLAADKYPEMFDDKYIVKHGITILDAEGTGIAEITGAPRYSDEWTAEAIRQLAQRFVDTFNSAGQ